MKKQNINLLVFFVLIMLTKSYGQNKFNDNLGNSTATKDLDANNYQLLNLSSLSIGGGETNNPHVGLAIRSGKTLVIPTTSNLLASTSSIPLGQTLDGMLVYDLQTQAMYIRQSGSWSKLITQNLPSSQVYLGDTNNTPTPVSISGDAVLNNQGVATITNNAVTSTKVIDGTIDSVSIANQSIELVNFKTSGIAGQVLTTNGTPLTANWVTKTIPFVVGQMKFSAQNADHDGWLICDGRSISKTTYASLFSILNTSFGASTTTNFSIPNLAGRYIGGIGTGPGLSARSAGSTVGTETTSLTDTHLPSHTHTSSGTDNSGDHIHNYVSRTADGQDAIKVGKPGAGVQAKVLDPAGNHSHTLTTPGQGSGAAFNILQPTLFVGKCFIYSGVR